MIAALLDKIVLITPTDKPHAQGYSFTNQGNVRNLGRDHDWNVNLAETRLFDALGIGHIVWWLSFDSGKFS